jgi:hypothetical protein
MSRALSVCPIIVLAALCAAAQVSAVSFPGFKVGDRFVYSGPPAKAPSPPAGGGPVVITMFTPTDQTITVAGEAPCGKATCLTLEAEQTLPSYGRAGEAKNGATSKARVNKATGDLVEIENILKIAGQERREATPIRSRNSLFAEFYGPWMLDLGPGYKQSFPLAGGKVRTFAVVGQEKVAGRDCYVVKRVTPGPQGGVQEATYWVDVKGRFTVQVDHAGQRLTLKEVKSSKG